MAETPQSRTPVPLDERPRSGPYSGLTYRSAKRFLTQQFTTANLPFAGEDALDLLLGLTGLSRTDYALRGTEFVPADYFEILQTAAERRLSGEPVDRILGWREFYGRRFTIENVLSPRGDTEVLLLRTLEALEGVSQPRLLDLGTGSGALALSILCERDDAIAVATDKSEAALNTTRKNANALDVSSRLTLIQSDWFDHVGLEPFDAIISNPPYISSVAMQALEPEVAQHDPDMALHGGEDGLEAYRIIIPQAAVRLVSGGWLGVEIGFDQADAVQAVFHESEYESVQCVTDPAGLNRVICGHKA